MNSKKLRVGVIGLGIGEAHLEAYSKLTDLCEIRAVCDFEEEKIKKAKRTYPSIQIASKDASELTTHPDLDLLSICSNDDHHYAQIVSALKAGKHLFVEKPLCQSLDQLNEISALLTSNPSLYLSSNLILRRSPRFIELRELIKSGKLGELFLIEGDYNYGRFHKITSGWRGEMDYYSGVLGGGVHIIDLFLWVSGGDQVVEVQAMAGNKAARIAGSKCNDLSLALLRFKSGLLAKLSVNLACIYPHFHRFSVYGTKATFENGREQAWLYTSSQDNTPPTALTSPYPAVHKGALIEDFIHAIVHTHPPSITWDQIEQCLRVCFAIEQSISTGETVKPAN